MSEYVEGLKRAKVTRAFSNIRIFRISSFQDNGFVFRRLELMEVAIEDNSITLMSLVTTNQLGRTLSKRTCSGIVLALLLLCSIIFFFEAERKEASAGISFSKILVISSPLHAHERARL